MQNTEGTAALQLVDFLPAEVLTTTVMAEALAAVVLAAVAEDAPAVAVPAEAGRLFFFKKTVKYAAKTVRFWLRSKT